MVWLLWILASRCFLSRTGRSRENRAIDGAGTRAPKGNEQLDNESKAVDRLDPRDLIVRGVTAIALVASAFLALVSL